MTNSHTVKVHREKDAVKYEKHTGLIWGHRSALLLDANLRQNGPFWAMPRAKTVAKCWKQIQELIFWQFLFKFHFLDFVA